MDRVCTKDFTRTHNFLPELANGLRARIWRRAVQTLKRGIIRLKKQRNEAKKDGQAVGTPVHS